MIAPEVMFTFFTVMAYYFVFKLFREARIQHAVLAGFALGLAALVKGTILLVLPAVCLATVLWLPVSWRQAVAISTLVAVTTFAVIAPLSLYTYLRWNEFSLILDGSGLNFWIANSDESIRLLNAKTGEEFKQIQLHLWMDVLPAFEEEIGNLAPASRDAFYLEKGWEDFKAHPGVSLWMMYERFKIFWGPWVHPKAYGMREVIVSALASIPLFICGFFTLLSGVRKGSPDSLFAVLAMVTITLVAGMVFNTEIRWRIPLIDTLLILFTASGLTPYLMRIRTVKASLSLAT